MVGRKCPGCGEIWHSADSGRPWVCGKCGVGIPAEAQEVSPVLAVAKRTLREWIDELSDAYRYQAILRALRYQDGMLQACVERELHVRPQWIPVPEDVHVSLEDMEAYEQ